MALGMLLWSSGGGRRVRMPRSCSEATGKALGMLLWSSGGLAPGRKLGSHSHRLARRGGLWLQGAHGSQALAGMVPTGRRCGSRARRFHWDTFTRRAALCRQGRKL